MALSGLLPIRWNHVHWSNTMSIWNGWEGAWGGFLLAGVARVVAVHHLHILHWREAHRLTQLCLQTD